MSRALLFLLLAFAWSAAHGAEATADEIIQKAIARDDLLRQRRIQFAADQVVKTERLDSAGNVTSSGVEKTPWKPSAEIAYNSDVHKDDVKSEKIAAVMDLGKLAPRFRMSLVGENSEAGRPCYIIRFFPKGNQPAETREQKVVNELTGKYWIAKDDASILRCEGQLSEPVTVALIASVTRMDFLYTTQTLPNGDPGPASTKVDLAVKAPLYSYRQRQTTTLTNWRAR